MSLSYDVAGNLLASVDALGNTVRSLNYSNQVTQSTDALGHSDRYQYDVLGRLNQDSDPLDNSTAYSYDSLNRLIQSIDALQGQSAQDYDADGNRTTLTDPEGNQTWFTFDLGGRLTESRTAANSPMQYTYNARDLITQITNGRGQNHVYAYDAAGRLTSVTTPEGATAYTYDNNGNVLTVTDTGGTISRQYDALNRVVSYTDASGNHIGYEYDAVGNLVTLTYPDGKQVHYEYDVANHLVKVTDWANRETAYSYDANGRLIETRRPNGTKQTRAYDAKGQLLSQTDSDAAGNVIARFGFTYDTSGDISEETGLDESALDGRLSQPEMTYGPGNRLATYNGESVQFDADGNMTRGPLNGVMADFVYDSGRRLIQAGTVQYAYDAENHRIGADGARFVVNSQPALSQVLVKTAADGARTFYIYGLGLIGEESAAGYKAYHFDFRGSTVALSDESGAVLERFGYSAYGVLLSGDVTLTPFLFNGMYGVMTDGNGLYHMRARFYSTEIRRFLNRDVLVGSVADGQSLNRFAFVEGKLVNAIDPLGLAYVTLYQGQHGNPFGHIGIGVYQETTYGAGPNTGAGMGLLSPVPGHVAEDTGIPIAILYIPTTPAQDVMLIEFINNNVNRSYKLIGNSCVNFVADALFHINVNVPSEAFTAVRPTRLYDILRSIGEEVYRRPPPPRFPNSGSNPPPTL